MLKTMHRIGVLLAILALGLPASAQPEWVTIEVADGPPVRVGILAPESPQEGAPVLLAIPPGTQDESMVEQAMAIYWRRAVEEHGWVVVSPAAPGRLSFHMGSEKYLPEVMALIDARFAPERVHVVGVSSGGKSAFRVAEVLDDRCASLSVLPGYPPSARDVEALHRLEGKPVTMLVGALDRSAWIEGTRETAARLGGLGADVRMHVLEGEGHQLPSDAADLVFERIAPLEIASNPGTPKPEPTTAPAKKAEPRAKPAPRPEPVAQQKPEPAQPDAKPVAKPAPKISRKAHTRAINEVLDDWHDAASDADFDRYFGHFTRDGVFLGTDDTERWTRGEFEDFARPYFAKGSGWTYVPVTRHVILSADGHTAWFDEQLDNRKLGRCRGTGVLVVEEGRWRLAHYSLTIPIPNAVALEVVEAVRAAESVSDGKDR